MNGLYNLKEGDKVIVKCMGMEWLETVGRTTNNYIIVGNNKYRKDTGYIAGDKWSLQHIAVATPEIIERIRYDQLHKKLVKSARDIRFDLLSNEQLKSILNIAKKTIVQWI